MVAYPCKFEPDGDGFVVTCRDIPEAITQGDTLEEARQAAQDALATALEFYVEDHRTVPSPSKARRGEELVELPLSLSAKVFLLNEMVTQGVRPADLARRMGVRPQEVTRIMDMAHSTKIDTLATALAALGRRLTLSLEDAATPPGSGV